MEEINKQVIEIQLLQTSGKWAWISIDVGERQRDSLRFRVAKVPYDEYLEVTQQ